MGELLADTYKMKEMCAAGSNKSELASGEKYQETRMTRTKQRGY